MRKVSNALWMFLALAIGCLTSAPARAHGATAGSKPVVPGHMQLRHRSPAEIVALFAREDPGASTTAGGLRAARAGHTETLLPEGVDALLRSANREIVLVGSEAELEQLASCIEIVDVPRTKTTAGRERMVITTRRAETRSLRSALRHVAGSGTATGEGSRLVLEGSPEWLHRALRQVIRAELRLGMGQHDRLSP